jgi:Fur family transcriptional regulator, ferric uptake regulator
MATGTAGPLRFRSPESVLNTMRGEGLRISTARRVVVASLFAATEPVSAEELAGGPGAPQLDLASVYRNLERLEKLGVVQRLRVAEGPHRYALARAGNREFLACEHCGAMQEADPGELDAVRKEIRRRFGFEARFSRLPLAGRCRECAGG